MRKESEILLEIADASELSKAQCLEATALTNSRIKKLYEELAAARAEAGRGRSSDMKELYPALSDIFELIIQINAIGKYEAFLRFSGHVHQIEVYLQWPGSYSNILRLGQYLDAGSMIVKTSEERNLGLMRIKESLELVLNGAEIRDGKVVGLSEDAEVSA